MTDINTAVGTDDPNIAIQGNWNFDYTYFAGATATRFFRELERKHLYGTRCTSCARVLVPARSFCDACFARTDEWVEVGPEGVLETFTIITAQFPGLPKPPVVMAYVTLDGADTALVNLVKGLDVTDLQQATDLLQSTPRVRCVFKDEPEGRITDVHFELLVP
ncbi:Zn-ribbon domain-containing OB-fold protein [Nocardioides sp.]|uniref:Zn-ribbon domain-containing OB-fold protein n=1 Tax=Nocardioides sp. TaxID=35761 RepID=UPI00261A4D82|nr:Zn-ribbon domain-containing OB-fold protein [Nocardioides sp.]MCW2737956.1 putative nucleic-acid-binding protein containing a Zn-ribbon [Nocardioides sp.]